MGKSDCLVHSMKRFDSSDRHQSQEKRGQTFFPTKVEVSKWPKEPGRKPGELRSSQVQIHAFYSNHALVAQTVERLVEAQEVGGSKSPRCANSIFRPSSTAELPPVKRQDAGSNPATGANHGGVSEKADALQAAAGRFDSDRLHSMTSGFQVD